MTVFLQVSSNKNEIILNTPNRNEILREGPPDHSTCNILGRGAYGTVFKAVFKGKQVAVKVVNTLKDVNLQSMRNEAHVLGWKHRNIIRILKIESTPRFGIVIMERFAGQCLQFILELVELSLVHRVFVSLDILSALSFCHRRHLLHLDVKPQNILLAFNTTEEQNFQQFLMSESETRNYTCKLCDFGSSLKIGSPLRHDSQISRLAARVEGTVRYMAPEVLCEESLTAACDIYSLGITMWQMQHRQVPYFWIKSNEAVAYQVVKMKIRPDSTAALPCSLQLFCNSERHRDCLCEHFSSEHLHRSMEHIKLDFLSNKENIVSIKATEDDCRRRKLFNPRNIYSNNANAAALRLPFRNLNSLMLSNHLLRDSSSQLSAECRQTLQQRERHANCVPKSITGENKERGFELLYKSCWHSDMHQRLNAIELRRKLEELL